MWLAKVLYNRFGQATKMKMALIISSFWRISLGHITAAIYLSLH